MSIKHTINLFKASTTEYFSIIIFSMGIALLSFTQIYFHEVYHYSVMQASFLLSVATIGQFLGSMLSSQYVKLINNVLHKFKMNVCPMRSSIFLLAFFTAMLFISFNFNRDYYVFVLLSFSLGVLLASFPPINMALLTTHTDLKSTIIVTFLRRWTLNIGACISFSIIGFLVNRPHQLFYSIAAIFFLFSLVELFRLFNLEVKNHSVQDNVTNLDLEKASPSVWIWLIAVFFSYVVFFQTISTYPIYLNDYMSITASHFSRLMILSVAIVLSFQFVTPVFEKRIGINAVSVLGTVLIGLGLILVTVHSYIMVIASVIIWSIGEIFLLGVTPIYAKLFAGNDREKNLKYSSNYYAVCYLGKMIGPLLGSYLYSTLHWHASLLIGFFILSILISLCFYFLGINRINPSFETTHAL